MSNVVEMRRSQPKVWVCECGSASFWARSDGELECLNCNKVAGAVGGKWFQRLAGQDGETTVGPDTYADGNGSLKFVERSAKRRAAEDATSWLMCGNDGGTVSVWSRNRREMTEEQLEWLEDRISLGRKMLME